jgi:acyl dehydratase
MRSLTYQEFVPGTVYEHELRRTITESDNVLLSCLTLNLQPLHIDADFAGKSMWGQILVDSMVTIGVIMGIHATELICCTAQGTMTIKEVRFPKPVFHGDTLRARTTVLAKNPSDRFANCGVVDILLDGFNQRDEIVMTCNWSNVIRMQS